MGYDLYSENYDNLPEGEGYFRWNIWGWPPILTLGAAYGWKPMGTIIHKLTPELIEENNISEEDANKHNEAVEAWDGSYTGNDGQIVIAKDANNLADALESCLDDIPDFHIPNPGAEEDGTTKLDNLAGQKHRDSLRQGSRPALTVEFSGTENKNYIRDFIKFLRLGDFSIC